MRLEDFRKQYPQYNDISDEDLAKGLHRRFYSDIPFEDFSQRVGFTPETGIARRVFGDVPVGIAQGATMGVRMISDAFGAGNPISESLKGVEDYLGGLLSAQATNNLDAMAKIIKESEDKGVLEQVKAGFKGLTEAPVEVVSQFLGTAAPTILAGVGGALAKVGATGIGAIQAGTGATMGAGLIKGNIYEAVKDELTKAGVDPKIAEERATFAQNYTGENWDQILLGTGLGGAAALGPLERIFARVPAIPTEIAAKNMVARGVTAGVMEGAPEFTQAFQEQVASNIALQREGFDVPTYRGAVANATLEGLAGFGVGAPIGMLSRRQRAEQEPLPQPPGQPPVEPSAQPPVVPGQPPAEPPPGTAPVQPGQPPGLMPGMVEAEPELSPEEEAELQQQIAQAPTRSSLSQEIKTDIFVVSDAINEDTPQEVQLSTRPDGTGNILYKDRVIDVTDMLRAGFTPERIVAQTLGEDTTGKNVTKKGAVTAPPPTPEVAAQVEALNTQLAKIQAKRLDPMLSPSDPVFQELDQQEAKINQQIQALARPQEPLVAKQQISAPETVAKQQIPPPETVAKQQIETVAKQQIEPTIEDQVRAQKSEERRERQAEQEAKRGEFVLQNRDRAGTASLQQMQGIASAPDYGRAGFSRTPDGAPIVAFGDFKPEQLGREDVVTTARGRKIPVQYAVMEADEILTSNDFDGRSNPQYGDKDVSGTRAIAGNGRVTGIREAFKYPGRTEKYVEGMLADTSLHGVDQDVIGNMKKPILVRIMPKEGLTRDIGDELNMSGMLELSPVEQSRNDLNRVDFDALAFDEDGEITNASLGQFINAQPVEERAKLVDRGLPTRQARQRLENAIFARAYNDDDLIAMFAQADDAEARLVINALAQVAPQMAKLEGAGDLDIRDIVTDAAKIIISGKRRGLKLTEIASQVDMTVDPDTRIIVGLFAQNTRSNKAAIEALNNAAEIAYRESIRPEEGLFGAEPKMERRELVEQMRRGYEPGRTQDVAQAQRPGPAPSDVERKAEPSAAAVPPADQGFALTGQTQEELAELERREKTGEAQREREEREAKEIADRARDIFTLERTRAEPTPTAPPLKPPADMFGATGMVDQPPRTAAPATPIEEAAAVGVPPVKLTYDEGVALIGPIEGPARADGPNEKISPDEAKLLYKMVVKTINEGIRTGKTREQIVAQIESLTKGGIGNAGFQRINTMLEDALKSTTIDPEAVKNTIDAYVGDIRRGTSDFVPTVYDEANNTLTYVETWKTDEKIPREDFDELVAGASKTDTAKGAKYSILVKDTPTESLVLTFQPRGLTPTQKYVDVFMQMEETTVEKPERTYKEEIEFRTKEKKLDDPGVSKKIQEAWGISKPVADAYIRAMKTEIVALANWTYGKGTEEEFSAAVKETSKIENRIQGIKQRKETKATKQEKAGPSTGDIIESVDLPDNMQVRILKATDGFSVQMYDKDSDNVVDGSVTMFKESVFEDDAFKIAKEYADNLVEEVRQETKEAEEAAPKAKPNFYMELLPKAGFTRLDIDDPRTYKNKSGDSFLTFERDGVRVAFESGNLLYADDRGRVGRYMGNDPTSSEGGDSVFAALLVDPKDRKQGKARKALQEIVQMADESNTNLYLEPASLDTEGMNTPQLKDFYRQFGFKPQETEPATDRVMVRKVGAKAEPKKEPSAGPTFAGMQAELERLKKEQAALGIPDTPLLVRDEKAAREEREAKEKKKREKARKQAERSDIEFARFDDLDTNPIQATPEQLKMAKDLAAKVNGELVFFDKDLELGLVVVPAEGFDNYFPIHDGKISKVDVSDYTGLSTLDKSFLNRISRALKVFRETSGKMLKGTEEEQKEIRAVAKHVGGTPVYFDPEKKVGLVRGYSVLSGEPVYIVTIGDRYHLKDIEKIAVAPNKDEMIAVKKRLEEEAAKKHKDNPFIKFDRGISLSDGIDSSLKGIITEWKSMLGLDNVNIYFSTIEDAKKNRDNFTGPHRSIVSGTLDNRDAGSMRRMQDGSYYVLFEKGTSKTSLLETIAHELGHIHEREAYQNAPQELKNKLKEAHANWLQQRKGKTAREAIEMLRAKTSAQTTTIAPGKTQAEHLSPYWSSFSEWYADQVSRWAVSDEKPVGVVEKFFARLGAALRRFYQTLKGKKYLPDETFVQYLNQVKPTIVETIPGPIKDPVQIEMSFQMQKDLFGSTSEAKQIGEIMEPKGKKLPPGRSPELTAAAQAVKAGTMTAEEYNKLVDVYKPIPVYAEPLRPATAEQVYDALDTKKREQINPDIPNGTKVGLRLDIPAFNRKGVFVVSIHQKRTASAPGKVIGYGSVAKAKNVTFGVGNQLKALDIAAGEAKDALQTIEGEYINISPEQAFAEAQRAIKDPNYVQIGIDPTRHAYFYDRSTTLPVVSAEEVIQIGNMILAKKPVFGKKENFLYNIESGPTPGMSTEDIKAFLEEINKEEDAKREVERQEKIAYYASVRRKEVALQKKVREYGSTIDIQRQLNNLNRLARELKEDIDLDKSPVYTAENFLRQARAALEGRTPYKEPAISADVFAVIQAMYMDDPKLLEGLRLSIKPEFTPEEALLRSAFGYPRASGAFESFRRIVYLYTGTKGVDNPSTIRHEITHTLEQMMTPAQRQAVISSYFNAVEKAAKKHKDARSQEFFEKLTEFLNNPNRKTKSALDKALPSYDFYQYVNPSEYWAVNAEKLMAQRLGTSWDRFKKAVRKMFEKLKDIFGFDNRYAVHQVFDQVMGGSKKRLTKDMLADFIFSSGERFEFLENIEDDADLMRRSGRADTPMLDVSPMKRILIRGASNAKESFKEMVENPSEILRMTFNPINRGIIYLRNKNVWFGTGLNEADRIRYSGQVRTAEGIATASLALDNMIRGGNIGTQVLFQGGIEYNPETLMFGAVKKEKNMERVYRAEAALKERLGDQLGTNISQGYLEAKRSRNMKDEVISRQATLDTLQEAVNDKVAEMKALDADPNASEKQINKVNKELRALFREFQDAKKDLETIKRLVEDKVSMSEEMIEEFISREKVHPELREIMDNFNAVNKNLLRFWRMVGLLSESRYNTLANIKDYVPWYRIMNDEEDVHSPLQATTRSATNIGKEKLFGPGKPSVINDFIVEENQNVFKIQPGRVNAVKLEGKKLKPEDYEVTPQGEVTLKVPYKPGDVLVIETQREIENMIDNMTRNVMRMTMNGLRQYAAQRIVSEYATRDSDGKIMTFAKTDAEKGRFDFIRDGRRTVVEIQDPLLAEAVLGMESVGMQMWKPLAAAANFTRRTITLSPVFQLKQVFKDAPTAALVTGVKRPELLLGGVYKGFIDAIRDSDPAAGILRSVGIGGFYSPARTPEADVKRQIGIINNNTYDYVMKALDHFGDSSDMAQRIAIYNRVMAETGDEALAMYQSANVINFLRHGSGQVAQALVKTVPFLNAYAQSIDVLYNALVGGGLRGLDRKKAMQRLFVTGSLLAGTTLLYAMLVGDDDDYMKMDDQSKVRSYMIPGTDIVLPMNTSAAFFFKAIPELTYNAIVSQGTENEMDEKRVRRALKEAAVDLLLGPTPVPSAVKPVVEISLNYDFFTSRPVVPTGLKDLDAYQQYDMRTSEAAKTLSALTGGKENRLLNPVEADHLIRGIFGTAGGMVAWSSNLIGEASEVRPEMGLKEMPITGAFLRPEVPRGREDLFYALKESTDRKFKTFNRLADRDIGEAEAYLNKHPNLIAFYDYTSEMDTQLKELNAAIRFIAETTDKSYTPEIKRREIQELLNLKQDILEGVEMFRREAYSE